MQRGKIIYIVCHCLLNANAKIYPLADTKGVYTNALASIIADGAGLIQLPCPETCYLGMNRWGMTKDQYDHPAFRTFCTTLLTPVLWQIQAYAKAGYTIEAVAGMDNSPNCGINTTCIGFRGGEISCSEIQNTLCNTLETVEGKGVFMEILKEALDAEGIHPRFVSLHQEISD